MSHITTIKKYTDPVTGKNKYAVFGLFADDSTEPVKVFDNFKEAQEFEAELLGEVDKQSNDTSN